MSRNDDKATQKFVELLNQAISDEMTASQQYFAFAIRLQESYPTVAKELWKHGNEELGHNSKLLEILESIQLGSKIPFKVPWVYAKTSIFRELSFSMNTNEPILGEEVSLDLADPISLLKYVMGEEEKAIEFYGKMIDAIPDKNAKWTNVIKSIIVQEKEHLKDAIKFKEVVSRKSPSFDYYMVQVETKGHNTVIDLPKSFFPTIVTFKTSATDSFSPNVDLLSEDARKFSNEIVIYDVGYKLEPHEHGVSVAKFISWYNQKNGKHFEIPSHAYKDAKEMYNSLRGLMTLEAMEVLFSENYIWKTSKEIAIPNIQSHEKEEMESVSSKVRRQVVEPITRLDLEEAGVLNYKNSSLLKTEQQKNNFYDGVILELEKKGIQKGTIHFDNMAKLIANRKIKELQK